MNVIEAVRQLGVAIQADDRYLIFRQAQKQNDADAALQEKIGEFNLLRMSLDRELSSESKDEDKVKDLNEKMRAVYSEIMANPSMIAYNAAKSAMDALINEVNSIIIKSINGEDPETCEPDEPGCSGSCASCSGCH